MTRGDYVALLRQYTLNQYKNGDPYIAEDFHPDNGFWLVDVPNRSEHYFHSTYNDLIITGLAGLRPRIDDTVEINPLIDSSIEYLVLENVPYHGHEITIVWDQVNRYGLGAGLHLLVNGHELGFSATVARLTAALPEFGDANFDGRVDVADLGLLASNWQSTAEWSGGDFNHDGFVDVADLGLLASHWQAGVTPAGSMETLGDALAQLGLAQAVPEPAISICVTLGFVLIGRRARPRR
jgi:hypothetical protein